MADDEEPLCIWDDIDYIASLQNIAVFECADCSQDFSTFLDWAVHCRIAHNQKNPGLVLIPKA